jgi:hypothetical protein
MKVTVSWDMMPCCLVDLYQCSEEFTLMMEAAGSSETLVHIYQTAFDNITGNVHLHCVVCPNF